VIASALKRTSGRIPHHLTDNNTDPATARLHNGSESNELTGTVTRTFIIGANCCFNIYTWINNDLNTVFTT